MKRARDDQKDRNPAATKRQVIHDMRQGAELDSKGVLEQLLIPAAARAGAHKQTTHTDLTIPNADRKLPWSSKGRQGRA